MKQNKFFTCLLLFCAITSVFVACKPKEVVLTDIKVTTLPTATEWTVGSQSFSTAGMVVTATYSDDHTAAFTEFPEPNWQITGFNSSAVTDALPITVSYTEKGVTKSDTFNIQIVVAPLVIESISIHSLPSQTDYVVGEGLNISGLAIKMVTNEGNEIYVSTFPTEEWTFTGFTSEAQNANVEVTVTFKNKWSECSTSFTVSVTAEVASISMVNAPSKDEYFIGEDLDLANLEIELALTDSTTKSVTDFPVTAWKVSGFDKTKESKESKLTLTMLLNGTESEFAVEIATVRVVDIKLLEISNYENVYFPGEAMRPMTITLTVKAEDWEEARTIDMDDPNLAFAGFDSSAPSAASSIHATYAKGSTFDTFSFGYKVVKPYSFCKEPKKLINHDGTAGLSDSEIEGITDDTEGVVKYATYVEFGDYPQSIVSAEEEAELTFYWNDSERTLDRGGVIFTLGSDGNYYVKAKENAKKGNVDANRTYGDGSPMKESTANSWRVFKVEPIKWRVMDTKYNGADYTLLMAEAAIDGIKFAKTGNDRTIDGNKVYPNNYKFSNIRAFLNGKHEPNDANDDHSNNNFINIAFTSEAAALLRETLVKNDYASAKIDYYANNFICTDGSYTGSWFDNPAINSIIYRDGENKILGIKNNAPNANSTDEYSTYEGMVSKFVCEDTTDSIFLLSVADLKNTARYGFKDETLAVDHGNGDSDTTQYSADPKRIRLGTDYTYANNAVMFNGGCIWAARSPQWASSMKRTAIVRISGSGTLFDIIHSQNYKDWVSRNDAQQANGLVPAICIDFNIQ